MPFNGSGTFVRLRSWVTDQANGLLVRADLMDSDTNDIASGLSACVTKDGQSGALTANLQMGSHKITGLSNGSSSSDAVNYGQVFTAPSYTGATLTGATLLGTIDGSGASSVLVPTPTLNGQAVNLSTLNAAVTAGGNAPVWVSGTTYSIGQLVFSPINFQTYRRKVAGAGTTDPSLDSTNWTGLGIGLGGTTLTGNVTLTSASPAAMSVTPATPGLYVTLPDATTVSRSTAPFSVYNNGDFDYGIKDSAGTQLGWIRARTGAVIGLADNSTAAGVWAYYGLEKVGVTSILQSASNATSFITSIAIDSTRTCFLGSSVGSVYAMVYDSSSNSYGAITLVRAATTTYNAILSAANQILVTSCVTTAMEGVTLTISGTGITVNSGTKGTLTLGGNISLMGRLVAVSTSFCLMYSRATTTQACVAMTVTGTTVAFGTEAILPAARLLLPTCVVSGSILRTFSNDTLGTGNFYGKPFTVSGTTLTPGTQASTFPATSDTYRVFTTAAGNVGVITNGSLMIFKLSSTTEAVTLGSCVNSATQMSDVINIGATKTLMVGAAGADIVIDTAGTGSTGTSISTSFSSCLSVSGTNARVCGTATATVYTLDCSGTAPVVSSMIPMLGSPSTVANPPGSDANSIRSVGFLTSGTTIFAIGISGSSSSTMISANAVIPIKSAFNVTCKGNASNEGFGTTAITTGMVFQRVEVAA